MDDIPAAASSALSGWVLISFEMTDPVGRVQRRLQGFG